VPKVAESHTDEPISVVVVMPAYNAAKTLAATFNAIPAGSVHQVILVDDASRDDTLDVARALEITAFRHERNSGYGANQKTCYAEALKTQHGIVVMLHPDYQYDPTLLPTLLEPILAHEADVVFGSRMLGASPMAQGMPWWKYYANRALTWLENQVFGLHLSEYHFVFDQEIVAQFVNAGFRIAEVPVPTRYFSEASSASFWQSSMYGLSILRVLTQYWLHKHGLRRDIKLDSLGRRYARVTPRGNGDEGGQ
jgi:glycosyltransferase involved in cell wall biosynthesis